MHYSNLALLAISGLTLLLTVATTIPSQAAAGDKDPLAGTWQSVSAELGGMVFPPAVGTNFTLTMKAGKYEVLASGNPDRGTYQVDSKTKPHQLHILGGPGGPNAGKTIPAIYEVTADHLKICYDLGGTNAPAEFKTTPGTKLFLVHYARKAE